MNKLGFGFLRLPQKSDGEYDWEMLNQMVNRYMESGRRYFDTSYTYLNGNSEKGIRMCVAERYPREAFELADKLPGYRCKTYADCWNYFREQLERCGVEFFDVYMLHWLNRDHVEIAERVGEFEFIKELKEKGLAKRIGFSYHDNAELLDQVLTRHPEVDVVLLQINYLDWETAGIESRKCYEVCVKHGKKVIVMEPVKGGTLANVPKEAKDLLASVHPELTPADWALRFVQSLPGVETCLSGMGTLDQVEANVKDFEPFTKVEYDTLAKVREIIERETAIPCTGCRYCEEHCPKNIAIPDYFKMYNEYSRFPAESWKIIPSYEQLTLTRGKASSCVGCKSCEKHCPQHICISQMVGEVAKAFE